MKSQSPETMARQTPARHFFLAAMMVAIVAHNPILKFGLPTMLAASRKGRG